MTPLDEGDSDLGPMLELIWWAPAVAFSYLFSIYSLYGSFLMKLYIEKQLSGQLGEAPRHRRNRRRQLANIILFDNGLPESRVL